jgi:hypothetical protein
MLWGSCDTLHCIHNFDSYLSAATLRTTEYHSIFNLMEIYILFSVLYYISLYFDTLMVMFHIPRVTKAAFCYMLYGLTTWSTCVYVCWYYAPDSLNSYHNKQSWYRTMSFLQFIQFEGIFIETNSIWSLNSCFVMYFYRYLPQVGQ